MELNRGVKKKYITRLKWTHAKVKQKMKKTPKKKTKLKNIGQIVLVQ